jgi:hypothetical protein
MLETIRQYGRDKLFDAGESLKRVTFTASIFYKWLKLPTAALQSRFWEIISCLKMSAIIIGLLSNGQSRRILKSLRIVYALQLYWIRNGHQVEGRNLAEAAIASAEALPPLEGEAALQRKFLIARALSTLTAAAMSQGDMRTVSEVSAKCEVYAREIGNQGLVARALFYHCAGRLSVGDIEGVEARSMEALQFARESEDTFALGLCLV